MGLSVRQAMLIIVVGRLLISMFSTLIAWAGLKWHIGFTVQNRYSWGMRASYIPLLQRILLNFIWNAVQCMRPTVHAHSENANHSGRLEWRQTLRCLYHSYLALIRPYQKYLWSKCAYYNLRICWLCCLLVPFDTVSLD